VQFDNPDGSYSPGSSTNGSYTRGVYNYDNRYNIRIDHQINQRSQIFVRYSTIPITATRFFVLDQSNPLSQAPTDKTPSRDIAIGYTRVLSNNLVANFRYSWLRVNQQRTENGTSLATDYAAQFGLTPASGGVGFPNLGSFTFGSITGSNSAGPTYSSSTGTTAVIKPGSQTPFGALDQNFVVGQDFNYTRGPHLFQFGGEYRWIQSTQNDYSFSNGGIYNFSPTQTSTNITKATSTSNAISSNTGSSLATFILGTISSFQNAPTPVPGYYRWHYFAFYFQDDWRLTSKLTANLGVRYNVETPRMEKFNNQGSIVVQPGNLNGFTAPVGFCFSGTCGLPNTLWPVNYKGVEPRVGLAYALTPRVVVRGSYTLSHLPLTGYGNMQNPQLGVGTKASSTTGAVKTNQITNYINNPVAQPASGYNIFNAQRGNPIYSSDTISPVYVNQTDKVPYIQGWSFSVQFQTAAKSHLQLSYQGSKGTHLIGAFSTPFNRVSIPTVVAAIQSNQNYTPKVANPYKITNESTNGATPTVLTETGIQYLMPYQNFFNQDLNEIYPRNGSMHYHAFYANFNQRYSKNVTFLASYQWSKTLDNIPDTTAGTEGGSGVANDQAPDNPTNEWSLASFDYPSRFRVGFHAALPIGRRQKFTTHLRALDFLLSNITTSGIITIASGHPNAVTLGNDGYFYSVAPNGVNGCTSSSGCSTDVFPDGYTLRPDRVPGVPLINKNWRGNPFNLPGHGPFTPYFNAAAFTTPGSLNNPALGNTPRTLGDGRTPREFLFDARAAKGFRFGERYQLKLTATAQNVLNHPAFFQVSGTTTTSSGFGNLNQGTSAALSRTLHIGAEFSF
jgi:hypothetical protein